MHTNHHGLVMAHFNRIQKDVPDPTAAAVLTLATVVSELGTDGKIPREASAMVGKLEAISHALQRLRKSPI